jgi:2-polyprenyl-6-methoxyphenol hydroxylase-like FAD-dependent oxidoreductase
MELVGAMDLLAERGVGTKDFAISRLYPNGKIKRKEVQIKDNSQETFWIPRSNFVRLLFDLIEEKFSDKISVHLASTCVNIAVEESNSSDPEAQRIKVTSAKKDEQPLVFTPNLLLGCDGLKSKVRDTLVEFDGGKKFQMRKHPSLSSGLRYKVLSLPPNFALSKRAGSPKAIHKEAYVAIGALNKFQERIRLGLLPIQDERACRTANFITAAEDHVIWRSKSGEEILNFLERALPQLPIREIVSEEEAKRFAESEGGRFPAPQYVENFQVVLPGSKCGVALVGDALHAFPPDLGQGVNAGLEDIMVLKKSLQDHQSLGEALPYYERTRLPDVRALIRLMQIGYPLQYNQYKYLKLLWTVKFSLQLLLSKAFPFLGFTKPSFLDIQNPKRRYRDILAQTEKMAKTYQTTAYLLGALSALWCLFKRQNYALAAASILIPAVLIRLTYERSPLSEMNAKEM